MGFPLKKDGELWRRLDKTDLAGSRFRGRYNRVACDDFPKES